MASHSARSITSSSALGDDSARGDAQTSVESAPAQETASRAWKTFDELYVRHPRRWFTAFLMAYLCAAIAFAWYTPPWQSPDEPAHFNYIAHVARGDGLPVLQMGDYDQYYRDRIVGSRFDPALSIEPLRYEYYQPPLYYLTAVPIYWLSAELPQHDMLRMLRLYSVVLGTAALVLLYQCARLIFPNRALIPLGAMGFAGLIPMHVAMTAAVNNDGLAELLLLAASLLLLQWMKAQHALRDAVSARPLRPAWKRLGLLGVVLGLGLLTKIYAYLLLPVFLLAIAWVAWTVSSENGQSQKVRKRDRMRYTLRSGLCTLVPALLLGTPMWLRNMYLYGLTDPLALRWHDRVVVGQPKTLEWIEQNGWFPYGERAITFTFQSFWGVFGWMGVLLDNRIYFALMVFSGLLILGLLWAAVRLITNSSSAHESIGPLRGFQCWALWLLGAVVLAVLAGYGVYNLKFVQHQGRYLFWGMLPISVLMATAWRELLQPPQGTATGVLLATLTLALGTIHMLGAETSMWTLLTLALMTIFLLLQPLLLLNVYTARQQALPTFLRPARGLFRWLHRLHMPGLLRTASWALPFGLLFLLNMVSLFRVIVPHLKL